MSRTKSPPEAFRECHGVVLPLTIEHWGRHATGKNGWQPKCRKCIREARRDITKRYREHQAQLKREGRPPLREGQICDECFGLTDRRPFAGCPRCKLPYEPLPKIELVTRRTYERAV